MGEKSPEGEGRQRGTVKWFNASKGFGFVTPEEGGEELFVHQTSIQSEGFRSLREGETVEFNVETGEDGRTKAVRVTGPGGSTPQGAPPRPRVRYPPPFMFPPHMMGGRGARGGRYPSGFWYYLPSPAGGYGSGFMPPMGRGGGGRGRNGGRGQPPREPSGLQVCCGCLGWCDCLQYSVCPVSALVPGWLLNVAGLVAVLVLCAAWLEVTTALHVRWGQRGGSQPPMVLFLAAVEGSIQ
ncbi:unnamed protein product [Ostreobium quekettii]|uniref:CSD domain-containing protein n=1 Tax=Ostreobium quekettii TaxID=121088 RepID=A0A8S1JGH8_9CHLO|nr:unnamed protein product [Ostreobium quekettii]